MDPEFLTGTNIDYNLYWLTSPYNRQIDWNGTSYLSLASFKAAHPTQEVHGLEANPRLTAPAAPAQDPLVIATGDYHIIAGSPAIDSAFSDAPSEPSSDIEGNPRIDDPATANTGAGTRTYDDRGAYEYQASAPTVTTQAVTSITTTTATGNGNVTALGVPNPTQHGVAWGTALNPTIAGSHTSDGAVGATGPFTSSITGLTPGTLYHVRAYATNTAGTSYGGDVTFTALLAPTVTTQAVTSIARHHGHGERQCHGAGCAQSDPAWCRLGHGAQSHHRGEPYVRRCSQCDRCLHKLHHRSDTRDAVSRPGVRHQYGRHLVRW